MIKWAPIDDDGNFLIEEFEKLLGPRTKIVAITQMSNALGTIVPVKEVIRLAHARGIPVLVDASQAAVHMKVDVQDLDADFLSSPATRPMGRPASACSTARPNISSRMPPYQGGGEMINEVTTESHHLQRSAAPLRGGNSGHRPGHRPWRRAGLHDGIGLDNIAAHEAALRDYAIQRLSEINSLRIFGRARNKGAIVSFNMNGAHAHDVATVIDRAGVAVRAGTHCTQPLLQRFGVTATCRASFAMYNTREEVDVLAEALISAQRIFL